MRGFIDESFLVSAGAADRNLRGACTQGAGAVTYGG